MKNILRNAVAALLMLSGACAYAQMSGTYTIGGTNPDFATFTDAYNAMKLQKVNGNITFNVHPGTYNESLYIETWDYASSPSIYPQVTINGNGAIITSSNSVATIYIETEQLKMNGLIVNNTGLGAAIKLWCGYNTVENNTFQAVGESVIYIDNVDENIFQNNTIIGGNYGIYAEKSAFNKFYDNKISQFGKAGFYITGDNNYADRDGNELKNNYFYGNRPSSNSTGDYCAIDISFGYDYIIDDNEIVISSNNITNTYGIYIHSEEYGNTIKNNYIEVRNGIGIKTVNSGATLQNNTVFTIGGKGMYIDDTASLINNEVTSYSDDCINVNGSVTAINNSTFLYNSSTGSAFRATTGTKIVNNSFFNSSTNANTSAIHLGSAATCDYNNLYSLSSKLGIFNNVSKASLSAWRSATGKDSHSISADPLYADPELCSMQINLSSPLVNRALASEMPSYDITGEARKYNAIGAWDPYPSTSWPNTRSARQRAYDIRNAMRESVEMQTLLNEQNMKAANIETLQYSINYSCGLLNVISSEKEDVTYTLYVADMLTGETRMQAQVVLVDGVSQSMDLSALAPGYYVVRLVTGADTYSWKISK